MLDLGSVKEAIFDGLCGSVNDCSCWGGSIDLNYLRCKCTSLDSLHDDANRDEAAIKMVA